MFSAMVPLKRKGSWGTTPIWPRRSSRRACWRSTPSSVIAPWSTSEKRHRVGALVGFGGRVEDLEDALGPGERLRHPVVYLAKPLQGAIEHPYVTIESH